MNLDEHLMAIQARDTFAFARWMSAAEPPLRETLRSFATVIDVEAVLQEALLRVWQAAPHFEPDGQANGLLRLGVRIARNLAISETRRMRARPVPDEDLERAASAVEPAAPDPMLRRVIETCRDRLPEKPRQVLDTRLGFGGMSSDDDLAESLGMRLNTFLQNFTRARKLLAECLHKHGVELDGGLSA